LLACDPADRRKILEAELESWELSAGLSVEDWSSALAMVSDQLWNREPPELAEAVADYLEEGPDGGLLGDLTEIAVEHAGDAAGFLTAALARVAPEPEEY